MEDKNITQQESLLLIRQMIDTAKKEQKDDGLGWIIWGWMLFFASVLTVLNIRFDWFSTFFFWNVFGGFSLLSILWEVIRYFFFKKGERVKTYTADLFNKLNVGFFVSIMMIIVAINVAARIDMRFVIIGFALLINLYSFWILIYGTALNFKPSVAGAYISWAIGFGALFVKTFEQVMLLHALAVLLGYIIPGHIANREFNKIRKTN